MLNFKDFENSACAGGHSAHETLRAFNLCRGLASDVGFERTIDMFIQIDLGTVRRQEEQFNAVFVRLHPSRDQPAFMNPEIVRDKENFSFLVSDHALGKPDE